MHGVRMNMDNNDQKVMKTGTTTLAMVCRDGVVIAAEKKSTMGYLVASKESDKIYEVDDKLVMTTAGTSGDAQALVRILRAELKLFNLQNQRVVGAKGAAALLSNILQGGRWSYVPYMVQILIAGWDTTKPAVFSLDAIGGMEEEKKFFSTGSGSPMALGVLEDSYRENMSVDDGARLAVRAIRSAIERDIASGGRGIDVVIITQKGTKRLSPEDVAAMK